jgi:hypothetical protein
MSGNVLQTMGATMPGTVPPAVGAPPAPRPATGLPGFGQRLLVPAISEAMGNPPATVAISAPAVNPSPVVTNLAWLVSQPEDTNLLQVTGWARDPDGKLTVFLSNGRKLPSWMVAGVSDDTVLLRDGSKLMMALPPSPSPVSGDYSPVGGGLAPVSAPPLPAGGDPASAVSTYVMPSSAHPAPAMSPQGHSLGQSVRRGN